MRNYSRKNLILGFSLPELILTITLMGMLVGVVSPIVTNILDSAKDHLAIVKVQSLNVAQQTFKMRVPNAEQIYNTSKDKEAKYRLLAKYIPDAEESLSLFMPKGYTIDMLELFGEKLIIRGPQGKVNY